MKTVILKRALPRGLTSHDLWGEQSQYVDLLIYQTHHILYAFPNKRLPNELSSRQLIGDKTADRHRGATGFCRTFPVLFHTAYGEACG